VFSYENETLRNSGITIQDFENKVVWEQKSADFYLVSVLELKD